MNFELIAIKPIFFLMHPPIDVSYDFLYTAAKAYWKVVESMLNNIGRSGEIIGPLLYGIDNLFHKVMRDTPSMKLMVFRRL